MGVLKVIYTSEQWLAKKIIFSKMGVLKFIYTSEQKLAKKIIF
jgi:hypothetical protein